MCTTAVLCRCSPRTLILVLCSPRLSAPRCLIQPFVLSIRYSDALNVIQISPDGLWSCWLSVSRRDKARLVLCAVRMSPSDMTRRKVPLTGGTKITTASRLQCCRWQLPDDGDGVQCERCRCSSFSCWISLCCCRMIAARWCITELQQLVIHASQQLLILSSHCNIRPGNLPVWS